MKHWFLPHTPDVVALLVAQADTTIEGIDAFARWSAGEAAEADVVAAAEHRADEARRHLLGELRAAFSTPVDPEDLYELSERLDVVINAAKNAVREAEVMRVVPNAALAAMAAEVAQGTRHLREAFAALTTDADRATTAADAATKCQRHIERAYRAAMSELLTVEDLRQVISWREMYRRYARLGEAMEQVAERIWYSVVKET